ncbi:DUF1318 domain-containing protein [Desulfuromonas sp.]|uniref:DUF1318 domain-containing protein n=1 Tax=Desulfuromonas sp. TaxID=892 RepID=UPI0025B9A2C6|nr:DUF1318 domain-containing protein [Desulfuromonas sp.]
MKRLVRIIGVFSVLAVISCVTINIYFPAEDVRDAADQIVDEVWGDRPGPAGEELPPAAEGVGPGSSLRLLLQPGAAHAAQDIEVSTPEIRAIKSSIKERSNALFAFLGSGHVGIGSDGLLKIRSTEGLGLKGRGEASRLVSAENADRLRLYDEIARANGFPEQVAEVQAVFAESWREKAASGWYLEGPDGAWSRRQ